MRAQEGTWFISGGPPCLFPRGPGNVQVLRRRQENLGKGVISRDQRPSPEPALPSSECEAMCTGRRGVGSAFPGLWAPGLSSEWGLGPSWDPPPAFTLRCELPRVLFLPSQSHLS